MKILVTGAAGFIGSHLVKKLIKENHEVIGIDYDCTTQLQADRIRKISNYVFTFDILDQHAINVLFEMHQFEVVVNLAAKTGVRDSILFPKSYMETNTIGFLNILEACVNYNVKHLIYASSSSVYGGNTKMPLSETDSTNNQLSVYAVSKKSDELLANTYQNLYGLKTTGLRFFTVYGPYGRPDMAYYSFVYSILKGRTIDIYNKGNMSRDFTYIDDVIDSIDKIINTNVKFIPSCIYNIGSGRGYTLIEFIETIESILQIKAKKKYIGHQIGDAINTLADISLIQKDYGYQPKTHLKTGLRRFIDWYTN